MRDTAIITAVIFSIIATATFLSVVLTYTQAPQKIITYFTDMGVSVNLFWAMLGVICLVLGTFIEIVPVFYLTVPIFAALTLSFDQSLFVSPFGLFTALMPSFSAGFEYNYSNYTQIKFGDIGKLMISKSDSFIFPFLSANFRF